ncbi:uncharacterized membrane protein YhaH (DUF805 family) [Flavobacterium sp. PL11]|uniref:DUF805 domain-containing protein n=1 Tax=Flavobacterium sp. PL11 TaxID=3071717 RepID=UPI002E054DAA|nr:uncharacterized membrane protein YhaH (DUF805 family) [Flavobacterium sp. PL11]
MFQNIFSFEGRIRRLEYGISLIVYLFLASLINVAIADSKSDSFLGIAYMPMLWFLWAQGAKRCHDLGNNGWWQIIPFYILWMVFAEGDLFTNTYSQSPKSQKNISHASATPDVTEKVANKLPIKNTTMSNGISNLEVRNVNYSNLQDVLRKLRSLNFVKSLNYEILESTANITVKHDDTSQYLLDEFIKIADGINVLEVTQGNIIIKIK